MRGFQRHFLIVPALLLCTAFPQNVSAQDTDHFFPKEVDSSYIEDYKYLITARYYLLAQNTRLQVSLDPKTTLIYRPNETGRVGLAAFYSWFGLGLSVGTKLFRKDPDIYGTTKSYDFRVNAYGKFLAVEGYLQYYRGFYMNYRADERDEIYILPGMDLISIGIDGTYIYNFSRFSIRASFIQTERQKRSAGSLILKPTLRYYHISSDTGIIPGAILDIYSLQHENLLSGNFTTLGLGPGYIYTFVFLKNFYLTTGAQMEMNWNFFNYVTSLGSTRESGFSFPGSIRVAVGYNSPAWFIGASYISTLFVIQPGLHVEDGYHYHLTQIRFWVGTRFNAFKRWNKKKT